jgi:hypothetical protein
VSVSDGDLLRPHERGALLGQVLEALLPLPLVELTREVKPRLEQALRETPTGCGLPHPQQHAASRSYGSEPSTRRLSLFAAVLRRVLPRVICGRLVIDAPAGQRIVMEGPRPGPRAHLKVHNWRVLARGDLGPLARPANDDVE